MAARVLKKPKLAWCCKVEELGLEVGLDIKPPAAQYVEPFQEPHWSGKVVFSEEEKYSVHDVYATYLIGEQALGNALICAYGRMDFMFDPFNFLNLMNNLGYICGSRFLHLLFSFKFSTF